MTAAAPAASRIRGLARRCRGAWRRWRLRVTRRRPRRRIIVGAGRFSMRGWYATDEEWLNVLERSDWERNCRSGSLGAIMAEHVWEHLSPAEGLLAARHCHEFLAPGGYLRLAVPDGLHPDPDYLERVRPGGSGPGADGHRVLYSYRSLAALLEQAGFRVEALEYFDEAGRFHERPWCPEAGLVRRSRRHDPRNADGRLRCTSLIVDAWKDAGSEAGATGDSRA